MSEDALFVVMDRVGLGPNALQGQTAIVTGAGRGIGREAARALAWLGARVVVAERDEIGGHETESLVREAGGDAVFVRTDVSSADSVRYLVERTETLYGPPDVLINNAILCPVASVVEMDVETWDRVMGVNLRGAFLTCRHVLPSMLERGRGTIVNMVSTDAMPGLAAYIASKQGLVGFSQSLAIEVGDHGIRVIAFGPGMVDTPGIRGVAPELAPRLGMTQDQFLSAPLHAAYEGLMPAEHAGAATALLVARLADAYHGETVTGYEVLERAGVIQAPVIPEMQSAQAERGPTADEGDRFQVQAEIADLAREIHIILGETEQEFAQLPIFARPMARRGFRAKAGQSLDDWTRTVMELGHLAASQSLSPSDASRYHNMLERLIVYYEGVPAETARFTKDAELLRQIARITAERVATVRELMLALARLASE